MKLAFAYHPGLVYLPMEAGRLFESERGLTGSEISCLMYAVALAARGHDVAWFGPVDSEATVRGVKVAPYRDEVFATGWDAVLAWNRNDALPAVKDGALRILNMQMSEVGLCRPDWESTTDFLCPLSRKAAEFLRPQTALPAERWRVMYNGVDGEAFKPGAKVPGRCVWASSHDRGLHRLLGAWPRVSEELPHATLRIFYDDGGMKRHAQILSPSPPFPELYRRAHYIGRALEQLSPLGVSMHGAVSRERMQREFAEAEVLAYPCDPVKPTETFGVTVLEAMASECVPVLTDADAFGELWGKSCPMVEWPQFERYAGLLIDVMKTPGERARHGAAVRAHALEFEWAVLGEKLERFLATRGAEGLAKPWA